MNKKWTKDQQSVIDAQVDENLLVSASAGGGKTSVMIERIAKMIEGGVAKIDEILVMTFTNESSRDMRNKLRERLGDRYLTELNGATIGTFHKFCIDLVRTYFAVAGVNPAFTVIDEINARVLQDEVLDGMNPIQEFCTIYGDAEFRKVILSISKFLEWQDPDWIDTTAFAGYEMDLAKNCAMRGIIQYYNLAGEYFMWQFPPDTDCAVWANRLRSVKSYSDLHDIARAFDKLRPVKTDCDHYDAKCALNEILKKIRIQYILPQDTILKNQQTDRDLVARLAVSVRDFEMRYGSVKMLSNFLDFADLEKFAVKILSDDKIRERVRKKHKFIFVDEYQDTNAVQEKILRLVAGDGNVFAVGDLKQSIYAFRGTSSAIFIDRMKTEKVIMLNENFRSNPAILSFVNRIFGNIMRNTTARLDYAKTSRFKEHTPSPLGAPEVIIVDGGTHEHEAAIIADKIAHLRDEGYSYGNIAILARNSTHFDVLVRTLDNVGIKCMVGKRRRVGDLYEIALINNLLLAVHDPTYMLPRTLVMQSFVFDGSSDEFEDMLNRYHEMSKVKSVVDLLAAFIAEFNIIERLLVTPDGDIRVRNIYNFLNKLRGSSYADTVAGYVWLYNQGQLDLEIDASAGGDCVKIMTIHASKGLEFPVVFLYNTGAKFGIQDKQKRVMMDKTRGLCIFSTDPDENVRHMSIARLGASIALARETVGEEMRLLYVALTRAKQRLVIVGCGKAYQSRALEDFEILSAKSYLDFICPTDVINVEDVPIVKVKKEQRILAAKPDKELVQQFADKFNRSEQYTHSHATEMAQKSSVTMLNKTQQESFEHKSGQGTSYGTKFHTAMQNREPFDDATRKCMEIVDEFTAGANVWRELVLLQNVVLNGENVLVQGVIDLLAVFKDRAIIIDYKTTRAGEGELVKLYKPQLDAYAVAVGGALGLPVDAYIYSTAHGRLVKT